MKRAKTDEMFSLQRDDKNWSAPNTDRAVHCSVKARVQHIKYFPFSFSEAITSFSLCPVRGVKSAYYWLLDFGLFFLKSFKDLGRKTCQHWPINVSLVSLYKAFTPLALYRLPTRLQKITWLNEFMKQPRSFRCIWWLMCFKGVFSGM